MIKGNILFNNTSWIYDYSNGQMTALRGHKYHILPTSSSPLVISLALLSLLLTLVFNMHGTKANTFFFDKIITFFGNFFNWIFLFKKPTHMFIYEHINIAELFSNNYFSYTSVHILWIAPFFITLGFFFLWSSNAIEEGTTFKINTYTFNIKSFNLAAKTLIEPMFHSNLVRKGFKIGFILFIISEVMFFFGFFWSFFHSSVSPTIQIGAVWPPLDVEFITVKGFAVANTVILLTSGATLTVAHYGFELIPQKKNKLLLQNSAFTESEQSFEKRLNDVYNELNKKFFNSAKPEIYWLPFLNWISKKDQNFKEPQLTSIIIPFNILLNPFKKHFQRNFGLKDTETLVWIYINLMLNATLILAILFMGFQGTEYFISPVNINTGVYGSTFYMITGLHGAHVFIGTCFLFYCRTAVANWNNSKAIISYFTRIFTIISEAIPIPVFFRELHLRLKIEPTEDSVRSDYFNDIITGKDKKVIVVPELTGSINNYGKYGIESFESAAWYWHFVDVVWIFVFGFVYVWSHLTVLELQ